MKNLAFIAASSTIFVAALQVHCRPFPVKAEPYSTIRGDVVRLVPSDFSFNIAADWLQWNKSYHDNFRLSRQEIEKAKKAEGEWDRPFSEIVNSIFPIQRCAAHLGGEGWGRGSVSFGDVQMRAYTGDWRIPQIQSAMEKSGTVAASKFSKKVSLACSHVGQWQVSRLSYDLWHGDYGGTARIDVYARVFSRQTVALVFMYSDVSDKKEIAEIVTSFNSQSRKPK